MKDLRVVPLDYEIRDGNMVPCDPVLYDAIRVYCSVNLAQVPDFVKFRKVWAVAEYEGDKLLAVHGITSTVQRQDVPMFRVTGEYAKRATMMLYRRLNDYFADNGMIGHEVFLHINDKETPEQRCPEWDQSLKDVGAEPANRYAVRIK